MSHISFRLNGVPTGIDADPDTPLLTVLRGQLGLMGTHFGCGAGECGACNVLVDDHAVTACDTPLWSVADKDVTTIEGLGNAQNPHPLQRAFITEQALQCGYCVSGILMSAAALLKQNPNPTSAEVKAALDRNLCRCGSHNRMVRAILRAAEEMRAAAEMRTP
jgi:nicotinate dehydrogenase subunit A